MSLAGVQINQLRLRGDTRPNPHTKAALLASLDSQHWPGEDDPRIIFIKRLQVKSPWWLLARELAQQTYTEYQAATAGAAADTDSNSLAFASETHLVAQVLVNLLAGQSPWYQQTWLTGEQLAADPLAVLLHRPVWVPALLRQLQQRQQLATFFARLSDSDLRQLLLRLQAFLAVQPEVAAATGLTVPLPAGATTAARVDTLLPTPQQRWLEAWLPALLTPGRSSEGQASSLQLLACLGLWQFSPQQLHAPAAWSPWLMAAAVQADAAPASLARVGSGLQPAPRDTDQSRSRGSGSDTGVARAALDNQATASSRDSPASEPPAAQPLPARLSDSVTPAEIPADTEAPQTLEYHRIHQAGFLYFINWLRDYPALVNLPAPASPWLWLAHLQRECCAAWTVPLDETLQRLLLVIAGQGESTAIGQRADLDLDQAGFSAAALRDARAYLERRLAHFRIDSYDWLTLPARVSLEQGYIEVYVHQTEVRVAMRLAGLDLNPGWVPCLGRVIRFHFGNYPELQQEA